MSEFQIQAFSGDDIRAPLALLEEALRDGHPVPEPFAEQLARAVERGDLDVLAAWKGAEMVGVAVVSYRLNISAGSLFASIEDLHVRPAERRQGAARALLDAAAERCISRGISYVEVQVEENEAMAFYAAVGYEQEPGVRVFSRSYLL